MENKNQYGAKIYIDVDDRHGRDVQACPIIWMSDPDEKGKVNYDIEYTYRHDDGSTDVGIIKVNDKMFGGRGGMIEEADDIGLTWFHTKDELNRYLTHCATQYMTLLEKHALLRANKDAEGINSGFHQMKIGYYKRLITEIQELQIKTMTL